MIISYSQATVAVLLALLHSTDAGGSRCPCVPDEITFQDDFSWGCSSNKPSSQYFSGRSCSMSWWADNSSIKKVVIHDLVSGESVEVTPELTESPSESGLQTTYSFVYPRSYDAPSALLLDFYKTPRATGSPVASIDLYYGNTRDCVKARNPIFWLGDQIYFLNVLSLVETADPQCQFPNDEVLKLAE